MIDNKEILKARHIGRCYLNDFPAEELDMWSCPHCYSIINSGKEHRNKTTTCVECKYKIKLEYKPSKNDNKDLNNSTN